MVVVIARSYPHCPAEYSAFVECSGPGPRQSLELRCRVWRLQWADPIHQQRIGRSLTNK
jgi:hypothetical protein